MVPVLLHATPVELCFGAASASEVVPAINNAHTSTFAAVIRLRRLRLVVKCEAYQPSSAYFIGISKG
jgi:hypothetical protein